MKTDVNIKALVNLLDDPDEIIYNDIRCRLIDIGPQCIPFIERICFEDNLGNLFKERANKLIHQIKFKKILNLHENWLKQPFNLIDGVLDIDQYFFPDITVNFIKREINEMTEDVKKNIYNNMSPIEKVKIINDVIFENYRVRGDKKDYHNPKNSSFGSLIKNKKGNPLTISILYVEIARKLGIPIKGINLPNHFVVGYLKKNEDELQTISDYEKSDVIFYINPFSQGVILNHSDIEDFIKEINIDIKDYYFTPCKFSDITKRILTNLAYSYSRTKNYQIKNDIKEILALYENTTL